MACFRDLFDRPWWTRIWIVQEVICSESVVLLCGDALISWNDLNDALEIISAVAYYAKVYPGHQILKDTNIVPVDTLKHFRQKWLEHRALGLDLLEILEYFQDFKATDPRDKIYGHLAIANLVPDPNGLMLPNYNLPEIEVYARSTRFLICQSRKLDVLQFCDEAEIEGLPSWAPNWKSIPIRAPLKKYGPPPGSDRGERSLQPIYSASAGRLAEVTFENNGKTMIARGVVFDRIAELGQVCPHYISEPENN
jgi:hypothetical protein